MGKKLLEIKDLFYKIIKDYLKYDIKSIFIWSEQHGYKIKDINCIIPIYKNKKIENNIYCLNKKEQVSNYSLQNNKEYKNILKKAKKYNFPTINKTNKTTKYKKLSIYKDNINDDEVYTIWDYRGIYIVKNNNYQYKSILSNDIYDNVMATIVNKYYVIFDNRSVNGIEKIYYYDIENAKGGYGISSFKRIYSYDRGKMSGEITRKHITKANGIDIVAKHFDVSKENIISVGDNYNDLPMFEKSGYSIAMGNSVDEVKKQADYVTDDILQDGIYNAFKNLNII
mgnify:CR=1 FL=1